MRRSHDIARLYLDNTRVGSLRVNGWDGPWGFGDFEPGEAFARFAPVFGRWSLIMHAEEGEPRLSEAASEELRAAEYEIDRIHAKLYLVPAGQWRAITQLNIDGPLVEWREDRANDRSAICACEGVSG